MVLSFFVWLSLLPPLSSVVADVELVTSGAEADPFPSPEDGEFSSLIPGLVEDLLAAAAPAFPPTAGEVGKEEEAPSPPLPPLIRWPDHRIFCHWGGADSHSFCDPCPHRSSILKLDQERHPSCATTCRNALLCIPHQR